jgi:hypothetical protein
MIHTASDAYSLTDILHAHQRAKDLTRIRVSADIKIIRHTLGSPTWLASLTGAEFQNLLKEILPMLEQEQEKRKQVAPVCLI